MTKNYNTTKKCLFSFEDVPFNRFQHSNPFSPFLHCKKSEKFFFVKFNINCEFFILLIIHSIITEHKKFMKIKFVPFVGNNFIWKFDMRIFEILLFCVWDALKPKIMVLHKKSSIWNFWDYWTDVPCGKRNFLNFHVEFQ